MMKYKMLSVIFKKDLLEIIRNKRAFIAGFLMPALFIPFLIFFQEYYFGLEKKEKPILIIHRFTEVKQAHDISKLISKDTRFKTIILTKDSETIRVDQKNADVTLLFNELIPGHLHISLLYSSDLPASNQLYNWMIEYLLNLYPEKVKYNLTNLSEQVHSDLMQNKADQSSMMYPWIFILLGFAGAAFVSTEVFAGEKERKTLESLLTPRENRKLVLFSKYLIVLFFAVINLFFNIVILILSKNFIGNPISLPEVLLIMEIFILTIPILLVLTWILLSISIHAKSIHESKSVESVFFLILSVSILAFTYLEIDYHDMMTLVPFLNITLLIRGMTSGLINFTQILYYLISCIIVCLLFSLYNFRFIKSEKVLETQSKGSANLLAMIKKHHLLLITLSVYSLLITIGQRWVSDGWRTGVFKTQILFFGLPGFFSGLQFIKNDFKQIFKSNFKMRELIQVTFLSLSAVIPLNFLAYHLYQKHLILSITRNTFYDSALNYPLWEILVLLAFIPAICEELFFRGFFLSSLNRFNKKSAIIFSALIFALFHQSWSDFPLLFILGIWFCWLVIRYRNIYYAMIAHFINNAVILILAHQKVFNYREINQFNLILVIALSIITALILLRMRAVKNNVI